MQENKQDKYEFISEKIKEKPVNKKKLVYHVCFVVLLAVLFGIVASVTFVLCQPKIDGMLHPKEDPTITIPKDEPEQETETEEPDTETETNEPDSEATDRVRTAYTGMISRHCRMRCMRSESRRISLSWQ